MFNLLISGNDTAWEAEHRLGMMAGRCFEYSGDEAEGITTPLPEERYFLAPSDRWSYRPRGKNVRQEPRSPTLTIPMAQPMVFSYSKFLLKQYEVGTQLGRRQMGISKCHTHEGARSPLDLNLSPRTFPQQRVARPFWDRSGGPTN